VVELTEVELERLDQFEGGYSKQWIEAKVRTGEGAEETSTVCVYLANRNTMVVPPTEQYLTAIHLMLREHWNMDGEAIEVRSAAAGEVRVESSWSHPGAANLSLAAFLVEVNAQRSRPWKMPATISEIESKLALAGIRSSSDLSEALTAADPATGLNAALERAGRHPFSVETLRIFGKLLDLEEVRGDGEPKQDDDSRAPSFRFRVGATAGAGAEDLQLLLVYGSLLSGVSERFQSPLPVR